MTVTLNMPQPRMTRHATEATLVDVDETTALLGKPASQDDDIDTFKRQALAKGRPTPVPWGQLLALCATRLSDPISFTHIFPYVNEMMTFLKVTNDPTKVGYYSGLVESIFAIAQLCSTYQWAHLSDRIGRKPVVLAGTLGSGIAGLFFGWSKTLPALLLARCLAGVFSGTLTVGNTVLGDLTDSSNQSIAFPIYCLVWPLGAIIGPLLGGSFANPAMQFPTWFQGEFWKEYPYFLPGAMACLVSVVAVIVGWFTLKETLLPKAAALPTATVPKSYGSMSETSSIETSSVDTLTAVTCAHDATPTGRMLLTDGLIRSLCSSGFALTLLATSFEVVFVLFCFSPVSAGGLAFPAAHIGYGLAIAGGAAAFLQIAVMPYLLRTFDLGRLFKITMSAWPASFALLPFLHCLAERASTPTLDGQGSVELSTGTMALLWTGIALSLALSRVGCMGYSAHMLLTKDAAPSQEALGRTNGVVQVSHTSARALAPTVVSALFALSSAQVGVFRYGWAAAMVCISMFAFRTADEIQRVRRSRGLC